MGSPRPLRVPVKALTVVEPAPQQPPAQSQMSAPLDELQVEQPAPEPSSPQPPQLLSGVGIKTISDEEWAKLTPRERMDNLLGAVGYGLSHMFGMGKAGTEAVDNPKTTLATAAFPMVAKGVKEALPSAARAGGTFQDVMGAARTVPINVSEPGNVALRIMQMSERGATMPKVVRDFLKRATDPSKGDITYEEARDFASNISRLSADEFNRLNPALKREVGNLRVTLNKAVAEAAKRAGKGPEYAQAMNEYARAMRLEGWIQGAKEAAAGYVPQALGLGAAAYAVNKILGGGGR